ncbi:MAG: hypothetical protein K6C95_11200 [Lachnospiraceae bacterium]|nr:hypothetical protein [Lachnospiraceae bacterium]
MKYLKTNGVEIIKKHSGIYHLCGSLFSAQILVLRELNPEQHLWLSNLCSHLSAEQLKRIMQARSRIGDISSGKEQLVNSVFDVIMKANEGFLLSLIKEDETMPESIREYFHVDELEATIASQSEQLASQSEQLASKDELLSNQSEQLASKDELLARYEALFGPLPE